MLALCASFTAPNAHANDGVDCRRLNEATRGPDDDFRPPLSAKVIGSGRAYFYSAPAPQCMTKHTFIVAGDTVTVYKPYKRWYQVMYVNNKTGEDFEGWVEEDRLRLGGHLGGDQ
ncbi:bacterial SH3 domain protein [Burkholderia pseudomallei]|nr:bacterial SH3 domain protein [Burkholderia pseudomallei]CAJ9744010.1 bacterial SH3 domain protein [Burkholderia pseudomallei]